MRSAENLSAYTVSSGMAVLVKKKIYECSTQLEMYEARHISMRLQLHITNFYVKHKHAAQHACAQQKQY